MRHYSLFARSGQIAGRGWRRAAVAAVLAALGVFAGVVPAQGGRGRWHSGLVFHPARVVYGSAAAGQARDRRFILVNSGRAFTGRLTFTITGPGAGRYTLRNHCAGVSLPPGQSCSGVVRFAPRHAGQYRAQLTARATRGTRPGTVTATVPLTGTGTAATAQVPSVSAATSHTAGPDRSHPVVLGPTEPVRRRAGSRTPRTGSVTVQERAPRHPTGPPSAPTPAKRAGTDRPVPVVLGGTRPVRSGTGTKARVWSRRRGGRAYRLGQGHRRRADHTCGLQTDHTLWCWGSERASVISGPGRRDRSLVPTQVGRDASDWATV